MNTEHEMPDLMGFFNGGDGRSRSKQKRKIITYCDKCSKENFLRDDVTERYVYKFSSTIKVNFMWQQ